MKNYIIYSTLASGFVLFVFGVMLQEHAAVSVFQQHTWLTTMTSWYTLLALIISHALLVSLTSWLYIKKAAALTDGLRIGVIMGLFVTLLFGFQLMMNVAHLPLNFIESDMLNLMGWLFMFYLFSGVIQGLIFKTLMKTKNHKLDENNIYPCRLNKIKEPANNEPEIKDNLRPAT